LRLPKAETQSRPSPAITTSPPSTPFKSHPI